MSEKAANLTQRLRDLTSERGADEGAAAAALVPLLSDYLDDVAQRTHARLGNVAGVALTLSFDGQPWTVGASSALAAEVDLIQYEVGAGPCLHALREGVGSYVPDLAHDGRWGRYGPLAAAHGAASCLSVPVMADREPAAVLKVYSGRVDGLTEQEQTVAHSSAAEVTGGIRLARTLCEQALLLDDREAAMQTRRAIDLALGILMERTQCDARQAFAALRLISQHRNIKLRDAARRVLATVADAHRSDSEAPFNRRESRPSTFTTPQHR